MGLFKSGKNWGIDYRYPPGRDGRRIREIVGPVKDEAEIVLAKRKADIRQGRDPELRRIAAKPFDAMVKEFLSRHATGLRHPDSAKSSTEILKVHFSGKTLQEIGPKEIENFRAARIAEGASKATINRQRACLSKMFNCAIDWGYYGGENPCRRVKAYKESPGRVRYLTGDEAAKLIEKSTTYLRPIVVTALHTGGRLTEILRLKWSDVNVESGSVTFRKENTKSGRERTIPIDPELAAVLKEHRKVRTISGDGREFLFTWKGRAVRRITTAFERARIAAGLGDDVCFHVLRHSFASWYVLNGGDVLRLKEYLGHSDLKLTMRYSHLSPAYLKAGVDYFGAPRGNGGQSVDSLGKSAGGGDSSTA